jgi:uncharacterized protein with PQ loop repeat
LTTFSFLPQALQVIKTKDTRGINLTMYVMFVVGVFCWTIYGICLLYTSPSPRDRTRSRMPSSA